jgi:type I restriction enzyme S subunit
MPSTWPELALGDVAENITVGHVGPMASRYVDAGVPFLRSQNVRRLRLDLTDVKFIPPDFHRQLSNSRLQSGDVVVVRTGEPGACAVVPEELADANCADLVIIRPGPRINARFLAYYVNEAAAHHVASHLVGAVQQHFNVGAARILPIRLPSIREQEGIVGVLGSLDDKIEQNRRTGRALEGLARATFKAWFADFEPVKAKAAGAVGFPGMSHVAFGALPGRLTDSSIGPVPQEWEISNLGTVVQRIAMGPFGSDIKTDNFVSDGVPVIRGGNLTDGFVDRDFVFLTEAKADQLANANAFPGDLVITHRGTLGQIGLIPSKSRFRRYVVSQSQMLIRPNAAMLPSHFLYLFLTSSAGQHELLANRSQTGVPAISRPTTSVKAISLLLPQRPVVDAFEGFASALFDARAAAEDESHKLAALRDYLLPRLLSGKIRVRGYSA